ncbi:hypothetical protein NDU88_004653, partial [Pleurodeles waltl]
GESIYKTTCPRMQCVVGNSVCEGLPSSWTLVLSPSAFLLLRTHLFSFLQHQFQSQGASWATSVASHFR